MVGLKDRYSLFVIHYSSHKRKLVLKFAAKIVLNAKKANEERILFSLNVRTCLANHAGPNRL